MRSAGEKSELFIRKFAEFVGLKAELAAMAMANGDEEVARYFLDQLEIPDEVQRVLLADSYVVALCRGSHRG